MASSILFAWIGATDLNAAAGKAGVGEGPIGQAVRDRFFDRVILLSNYPLEDEHRYLGWLAERTTAEITITHHTLKSPMDFGEVFEAARSVVATVKNDQDEQPKTIFHLSPGTSAMAAVWILLAKTSYPAELIQSSAEHGVQTVSFPFDLAVDYLPDLRGAHNDLDRLTQGLPPAAPEFKDIVYQCPAMQRVTAQARRLASFDVSVLIQGESGTGKELFARAIHASSKRKGRPFVALNCGAIPDNLIEAELFGYRKGAFTGATQDRIGYLEAAHTGTLFLDEIGELSRAAQVRLLRALQERRIQRLGSTKEIEVDFRIIAATNRTLIEAVAGGAFREDLFHRLAVGVLTLPPLRERAGDLNALIDHYLTELNARFMIDPDQKHKKLSAGAKNLLFQHPWPGNVRELSNTLTRAVIWTPGEVIETEDIRAALFPVSSQDHHILGQALGGDFTLQKALNQVAQHYLKRAIEEAHGNKTEAARLVGFSNYQTFTNWMKKYGMEL